MQNLWLDIRYGFRMFVKRPIFTLVVVLTLALGIGANTAIFGIVNAVLIHPLPFREPHRLVMLWGTNLEKGVSQDLVSPPDLLDWRDQSDVFESVAAFTTTNFTLTGSNETERISGSQITPDLLPLLGVNPIKGRVFTSDEAQARAADVALVGHGLWQRRFGSDPDLVGKTITLGGKTFEVVGIMPQDFEFPKWLEPADSKNATPAELWTPLSLLNEDANKRGARYLNAIARLKPGVTPAQAQAALVPIAQRLEQQYQENQGYSLTVVPLQQQVVGKVQRALLIFFGAIILVLLIACTNVANLLLARAAARQKEIAIRAALGGGRGRLIRQLMTESLLLALTGGMAGLLMAYWVIKFIVASFPNIIPRANEITIDMQVFGFTVLISLLTGLLFGIAPTLQTLKNDLSEPLKEGGRGPTEGLSRNRTRSILVVAEVALALILLIGAGLLVKSFLRLTSVQPGFNPNNLVALRVALPSSKYKQPYQRETFFNQLSSRIMSLPGVQSVAMTTNLPLSGTSMSFRFMIEGRLALPSEILLAQYHAISPNYFRTMGIELQQGREFNEQDAADAQPVVIVNEALAKRFFPDEDPVGKRLTITYGKPVARQIIGVIRNVKHQGLEFNSQEELYVPFAQNPWAFMTLVARTQAKPKDLAAALKSEVWAIDRDQPIDSIKSVDELIADSVSRPRFYTRLLGLFAGLALILAAVGIYGVISYSVSQRVHEIGIRMALGAQPRDVLVLIIKQGLIPTFIGIAIGITAAAGLTHLMSSLVFGVSVTDPMTFIAVSLLFVGIALMACYIPARRAAKVDPLIALRYE